MEGTGFLGAHAAEVYRLDERRPLPGRDQRGRAGRDALRRGARRGGAAEAVRRVLLLLPSRGRVLRPGHQGHHPGALVRQGRDVLVRRRRRTPRRSTSGCWLGEGVPRQARAAVPGRSTSRPATWGRAPARKFDCEAWFPSQGRYRELTSTSNCTTFQSRRLAIRYRTDDGPAPLATLNGTLCAIARTIACLLEVHQQADGSVRVPEALRPHLGGREVLEPLD